MENWRKWASLAASAGISFRGIYGRSTMTNEGAERNVLHLLQTQQVLATRGTFGNEAFPTLTRQVPVPLLMIISPFMPFQIIFHPMWIQCYRNIVFVCIYLLSQSIEPLR